MKSIYQLLPGCKELQHPTDHICLTGLWKGESIDIKSVLPINLIFKGKLEMAEELSREVVKGTEYFKQYFSSARVPSVLSFRMF